MRQAAHDGKHHLSLGVQSVNIFLLKIDLDALFLKAADRGQRVNSVTGEPADGLGQNQIDFTSQSVLDHPVKAFALLGVCASYSLVGVYSHKLPLWLTLDVSGVEIYLRFIAGELLIRVGRHTGIGGYTPFPGLGSWGQREKTGRAFNLADRFFAGFRHLYASFLRCSARSPALSVSFLPSRFPGGTGFAR